MNQTLNVIPRPLEVVLGAGESIGCSLSDGLVISYTPELLGEARWFREVLETGTGWLVELAVNDSAPDADIALTLDAEMRLPHDVGNSARGLRDAAYRLTSLHGRLAITCSGAEGAFYGLQTLRQLLPDSTFRRAGLSEPISIPELEIFDAPRFPWRGVLLDVARHFMPKNFILELLDLLALHKCNVLHLHLTDDQGWRIEVEAHPRLTEVGAWRRACADENAVGPFEGGFYTRHDLDEIVAYAAERHIVVLPEIDMPGHTVAAIAAYPTLGNTDEQLTVRPEWGVSSHVLNLEESTIRFCTDVLDEVVRAFPGPYVHVGGDECPTTEWKTNPRAREIMRELGYTDEVQLQGWFTTRIANHLSDCARRVVVWDDALDSALPFDSVVMAWQGEMRGVAAVAAGHDVVMVPQERLYFDRPESVDPEEPVGLFGPITVEDVYLYDPVPKEIRAEDRHRVLGAQCQLWTELVATPSEAEYRYFPRLCAFAEVAWTTEIPERPKIYAEFEERLRCHLGRLSALGVNFRPLGGPHRG